MSNKIEGLYGEGLILAEEDIKQLGQALLELSVRDASDMLPPKEVQAYKEAQQSVVDAREAAPRNEGQIVIV